MANIDELFGGRCIWCQRLLVDVGTDSSHVYPAMLGFGEQMVLPPGVVCCECNNHFGQQAEVTFADDPQLHIRAVSARVPNRRHRFREELFDDGHPAVDGVAHSVNVSVRRQDGHSLRFDVTHALTGAMVWRYDRKRLTFLSRVVHKIAFESLAWSLVENASAPDGSRPDLHSAEFDPIRRWGRESQGRFRPVLRWSPDPFDSLVQIVPFEGGLIFSGLILGEGYAAAITGPNGDALRLLDAWAPDNVGNILVLGREIVGLATHRGQPESVAAGSVDLQFVVAAESVTVAQNGNLNVANVFTDIYPRSFPWVHPAINVALGFRLRTETVGRRIYVEQKLFGPDGDVVSRQQGYLDLSQEAFQPEGANLTYLVIPLAETVFPVQGAYRIVVDVPNVGKAEWPLRVHSQFSVPRGSAAAQIFG